MAFGGVDGVDGAACGCGAGRGFRNRCSCRDYSSAYRNGNSILNLERWNFLCTEWVMVEWVTVEWSEHAVIPLAPQLLLMAMAASAQESV